MDHPTIVGATPTTPISRERYPLLIDLHYAPDESNAHVTCIFFRRLSTLFFVFGGYGKIESLVVNFFFTWPLFFLFHDILFLALAKCKPHQRSGGRTEFPTGYEV